MKSGLPNPTAKQKRRLEIIKREIGCLNHPGRPADAHHLLRNGRRISHDATIPLCPDCHRGPNGTHKRRRWFAETYGTDEELLARTDALVAEFEANTIGGGR